MDTVRLRAALRAARFEWRRHALEQMAARGLSQREVLDALLLGEVTPVRCSSEPMRPSRSMWWPLSTPKASGCISSQPIARMGCTFFAT